MGRKEKETAVKNAAPRAGAPGKAMNLKGEGVGTAVGKCVSVLYDEGGSELMAYRGVVVYVERIRYAALPPMLHPPQIPTAALHLMAMPPRATHAREATALHLSSSPR